MENVNLILQTTALKMVVNAKMLEDSVGLVHVHFCMRIVLNLIHKVLILVLDQRHGSIYMEKCQLMRDIQ